MAILHYPNKIKLIFDIIFNPSKALKTIEDHYEMAQQKLVEDFNERLAFIRHERYRQYDNGILHKDNQNRRLSFCKMPIIEGDVSEDESGVPTVSMTIEEKNVKTLKVSSLDETNKSNPAFFNPDMTTEQMKEQLAIVLSKKLVESGYIQSVVTENNVISIINIF